MLTHLLVLLRLLNHGRLPHQSCGLADKGQLRGTLRHDHVASIADSLSFTRLVDRQDRAGIGFPKLERGQ